MPGRVDLGSLSADSRVPTQMPMQKEKKQVFIARSLRF
jgi:hypothetical protein